MFKLLVTMGYKGSRSSSGGVATDYDFTRKLIDENLSPTTSPSSAHLRIRARRIKNQSSARSTRSTG